MRNLPFKRYSIFFLVLISFKAFSAEGYVETAQAGSPESWRTTEFNRQWGLASIGAQYVYARGYNGAGVNIAIFDHPVFTHPKFAGKLNKVDANEPYNYSGKNNSVFNDHGTHVAGIAAAARNGQQMHGVAYNSGLVSAKYVGSSNNYFEKLIQSDSRIFNNSWGFRADILRDKDGKDIYLPDGNPSYVKITRQDAIGVLTPEVVANIDQLSKKPIPSLKIG